MRCNIFTEGPGSDVRNSTVVAAIAAVGIAILFVMWFSPPLWLLAVYLLFAVIAVFSVPALYRLGGYTLADELSWLENREEAEYNEMVQRLKELHGELKRLDIDTGVRQADTLTAILNDYHSVIESRFIGKKHSPLVYLSTARRVQKHAIQNLNDVVTVGHSLQSISRHGFDDDESRQDNDFADNQDDRRNRYVTLQKEQEARMSGLLNSNQQMFDALTDTAVEVANIESFSQYEKLDTLARLVSLSEIASNTGR